MKLINKIKKYIKKIINKIKKLFKKEVKNKAIRNQKGEIIFYTDTRMDMGFSQYTGVEFRRIHQLPKK